MNTEGDRLSNLPDDLIHNILAFINIREAIETSVLSSRWRFSWTSLPHLNFSNGNFSPEFVSNVLSRRNNQIQVSSVQLGRVSDEAVEKILNYTSSQNVQQLSVICDHSFVPLPLFIFYSPSLKHVSLSGANRVRNYSSPPCLTTKHLPALTTLHLDHITLSGNDDYSDYFASDYDQCIGLFSECTNLKNLSLSSCTVGQLYVLNLSHPGLSNLTIAHCHGKYLISAPGLTSLVMKGPRTLQLSTQALCSLEKVDLCIYRPLLADAHKIFSLLQKLQTVKFLTLNFDILEVLAHEKITTSAEVKYHHLDTSPSLLFTMVSSEETKVMRDIVCTKRLIKESRMLLEQCKALSDTNKGRYMVHANVPLMKIRKAQIKKQPWTKSSFESQWNFGEIMAQIKQCKIKTEGLPKNLPTKICRIISWLQRIEGSLNRLHASKRAPMQAAFSTVCEEAAFVTKNMFDFIKINI